MHVDIMQNTEWIYIIVSGTIEETRFDAFRSVRRSISIQQILLSSEYDLLALLHTECPGQGLRVFVP